MGFVFWGHRLYFETLFLPVHQGLQDMRQEVTVESLEFCVSWICHVGEPHSYTGSSCANKNMIEDFRKRGKFVKWKEFESIMTEIMTKGKLTAVCDWD